MKKLLFIAAAFTLSAGAFAQTPNKADAVAKFNVEKYDFGKVKQNVPAIYYFEITNKSDKPLVIENAHATCGCTTPEYQKDPIMPGKTTKMKVQFNAASGGPFNKQVYVKFAGVDEEKVLTIVGDVKSPEDFDTYTKEEAAKAAATEKTTKTKNKGKNKSGK